MDRKSDGVTLEILFQRQRMMDKYWIGRESGSSENKLRKAGHGQEQVTESPYQTGNPSEADTVSDPE